MPYSREDLFEDMASNIVRDCSAELPREELEKRVIDRLRRLAQLIDAGEI